MSKPRILTILGLLLLGVLPMHAQENICGSMTEQTAFQCFNNNIPGGCQGWETMSQIDPNGSIMYQNTAKSCSYIGYYDWERVGLCAYAELRVPAVRAGLEEVAQNEDFLVPNCQGQYVPFSVIREQLAPAGATR